MNFKMKLVAYTIAASLASMSPTLSFSSELTLSYKDYPMDSKEASKYWKDEVPNVHQYGELVPSVSVADVNINGTDITFTMLSSMGHCSVNTCPVRIYKGDRLVQEVTACSNTDFHKITEDGKIFIACDTLTPIQK